MIKKEGEEHHRQQTTFLNCALMKQMRVSVCLNTSVYSNDSRIRQWLEGKRRYLSIYVDAGLKAYLYGNVVFLNAR